MLNERSRRIADLFVEGTECYLGLDGDGEAIVVWVNKVNSFESEDARRDAAIERGRRIAELSKPDNEELLGIQAEINSWSNDRLAEERVLQRGDTISLEVLDDIEVEHKELIDRVRRGGELLDDAGLDEDHPKRKQLAEDQQAYLRLIRDAQTRKREQMLEEYTSTPRAQLVEDFIEAWRERAALEGFLEERRVSELFFALRDCRAKTSYDEDTHKRSYDHSGCDHSRRLLDSRAEVRSLPEGALAKITEIYDNLAVSLRESGNSDAPASSSASSEQPSAEAESTPSTPTETSPAAPST